MHSYKFKKLKNVQERYIFDNRKDAETKHLLFYNWMN